MSSARYKSEKSLSRKSERIKSEKSVKSTKSSKNDRNESIKSKKSEKSEEISEKSMSNDKESIDDQIDPYVPLWKRNIASITMKKEYLKPSPVKEEKKELDMGPPTDDEIKYVVKNSEKSRKDKSEVSRRDQSKKDKKDKSKSDEDDDKTNNNNDVKTVEKSIETDYMRKSKECPTREAGSKDNEPNLVPGEERQSVAGIRNSEYMKVSKTTIALLILEMMIASAVLIIVAFIANEDNTFYSPITLANIILTLLTLLIHLIILMKRCHVKLLERQFAQSKYEVTYLWRMKLFSLACIRCTSAISIGVMSCIHGTIIIYSALLPLTLFLILQPIHHMYYHMRKYPTIPPCKGCR